MKLIKNAITPHNTLFHAIQRPSLSRLKSILTTGGLLSRRAQSLLLDNKNINSYASKNWNGDDYICLCKPNEHSRYHNSAFDAFVAEYISIIFDESVLELEQSKDNKLMPDEIQIKNSIPLRYFKGIAIPSISRAYNYRNCAELDCKKTTCTKNTSTSCVFTAIKKIQQSAGTNLDIHELDIDIVRK